MLGQKSLIENRRPGFYTNKYGMYACMYACTSYVCTFVSIHVCMYVCMYVPWTGEQ